MSRGILIGDKHTFNDWGLILTRAEIGYPAPKTNYIDIPHGNGSLDLTEAMGGVKYSDRTGTFEFDLIAPPSERQSLLTTITNYIHGRKHTIVLPDDPDFVYHSRLAINNVQTSCMLNKLVISVVSDPYRVKPTATVKELYLVENLIPENARQFESPPWVKYGGAEVSVTPAPIEVFEEGYTRNLLKNTSDEWTNVVFKDTQYYTQIGSDYEIEIGQTYIFSIIVEKISEDTVPITLSLGLGVKGGYNWDRYRWTKNVYTKLPFGVKYSVTFTTTNEDIHSTQPNYKYFAWRLRNEQKATTVRYKDVKLEKGNNPNPTWTPAWEDLPLEDKPVSFIETSGGMSGLKYGYALPNSYDIGEVNIGMKIKNISEKRMRFVVQQDSNAVVDNIQVGEVVDIDRVWNTDGYTNLMQLQFRSETNSAGDDISFYAYQPAVYEVHGNTDVHRFDGEVEVNLFNEGDNVVPKIKTDAEITIKFKDLTFTVNAGTHILTALVLEYGDNIVTISGEDGTNIKFEYTERAI